MDTTARKLSSADLADVEIGGLDWDDYPKFCDAYLLAASCAHTGRNLTTAELESVDPVVVAELVYQYVIGG
jgi:hypothetical protein